MELSCNSKNGVYPPGCPYYQCSHCGNFLSSYHGDFQNHIRAHHPHLFAAFQANDPGAPSMVWHTVSGTPLGLRLAFEHVPETRAVVLRGTMCLEAFLRRLFYMTPCSSGVPSVRWRLREPTPAAAPKEVKLELQNSLDVDKKQCAHLAYPLKEAQQ